MKQPAWQTLDSLSLQFLDELVKKKEKGGQEAAQRLLDCCRTYLHGDPLNFRQDIKIHLTVCCNLKGLSKTYVDANILEKPDDFTHFVRGFNMGNSLCYMVDAGSGKECSDDKLRGIFYFSINERGFSRY